MQAIKDTWNGFMARRRLDQLWYELQDKKIKNQNYVNEVKQFLNCFLTMMQKQPPIESIFGHREALLDMLLLMLVNNRNATSEDLRVILQALMHISKDILAVQPDESVFVEICNVLVKCVGFEQHKTKLRQTLKVIQFLFAKVEGLKVKMAEQGIFVQFLECVDGKDEQCQAKVLDFLQQELLILQEGDESAERWSLLSDQGKNQNLTSLANLISKVKDKILNEIPTEYQQQLQAERHSDTIAGERQDQIDQPFTMASGLEVLEPLTTEQIDDLLTRGDSNLRHSKLQEEQNSKVLLILRGGAFIKELIYKFDKCEDTQISVYLKVAQILNCFTAQYWTESEENLLQILNKRFTSQPSDLQTLVKLFNEVLTTIVTNNLPDFKIRNLKMFAFALKIIENSCRNIRDLLYQELMKFLMLNQANSVIFYKEGGFKWFSKLTFSEPLVDLVKYVLHVLSDLQTECKMYLISLTTRLLDSPQPDAQICYSLLRSFFQDQIIKQSDQTDELLKTLFTNCVMLSIHDKNDAHYLLATCFEYQLSINCNLMNDSTISQLNYLFLSDAPQDTYLAAYLVKCQLHNNLIVEIDKILEQVPQQNKQLLLRLLYCHQNNKYASVLKEQLTEIIDQEYSQFKDCLLLQQWQEATNCFVNISIMASGCPKAKDYLSNLIQRDEQELLKDFNLSEFTSIQQRQVSQCLLKMYVDQMCEEANIIWDYNQAMQSQSFSDFVQEAQSIKSYLNVQSSATQQNINTNQTNLIPNFRRVNYNFLFLMVMQLSYDNIVYVLQKISDYAVTCQNKQILIEAGLQHVLLTIIELSNQLSRQQEQQLKQFTMILLNQLLEQNVLTSMVTANQLLQPGLVTLVTQILSQNPSPQQYGRELNSGDRVYLRLDCRLENVNNLFTTTIGQKVRLHKTELNDINQQLPSRNYSFKLLINDDAVELDSRIDLGIFEVNGWNEYEIKNDRLLIAGIEVPHIVVSGAIIPDDQTIFEVQQIQQNLIEQTKQYVVFDQQSESTITVFGRQLNYAFVNCQIKTPQNSCYFATDDLMPLKQFLMTSDTIQYLLTLIDRSRGDNQILQFMRLLTALVTKPAQRLHFDLESLVKSKLLEMHPNGIQQLLMTFLDLALGQVDSHLRLVWSDEQKLINKPLLVQPQILEIPLRLLQQVPAEQGAKFIEMLQLLLQNDNNLLTLYQTFGIEPILNMLILVRDNSRKLALYETCLGIFELFIDGVKNNKLDTILLRDVFDFIQKISFEDAKPMTTRIVIDCLAVIMIHVVVDESGILLQYIFQHDFVQFIYKLLQSKLVEIREYIFKMLCLITLKHPNISICYQTIQDLLGMQEQSMNLCLIILDSSIGRWINVNDLAPEDNSQVIQMMNSSKSAQKIVNQMKQSFQTKKKSKIINYDMIDCFIKALAQVTNDVSRQMCLKQFTSMLTENENIELVHDRNKTQSLIYNLFDFQISITSHETLSFSVREFYHNYLFEKHTQLQFGGYSTTEDDPGNKSESNKTTDLLPPTRTVDAVLDLVSQIVIRDLYRPFFQSEIFNLMLMHHSNDDRLQLQIITRILRHFYRQPKINDKNVLLNLNRIFANLDKLLGENEGISLKVINLINLIAFKSTTEVRKLMKDNKLLELRDQLIVRQIRKTYQQSSVFLIQSLSKFSFDSIASKPIFQSNCCTEYLVLILDQAIQLGLKNESQDIRHRLETEICQFETNAKSIYGQIDQLKSNIPQQLIDKLKAKVMEHLQDQTEESDRFKSEREGRRQILVEEYTQLQHKRALQTRAVLM